MKFRIKEHRKRLGLTLDQLATASGLTKGYLSLLENEKRDPSAEALRSLAAALEVDVTDMIAPETADARDAIEMLMIFRNLEDDARADLFRIAQKMPKKTEDHDE
ncbi:helix-turn-helix domain-containing protein [Paracoccus yeei]|uniref:helix-turn-helix domain-containing protein n=1 Tax=Paracoccus yeei TaxID=147645 RepID=UPI00174D20C7|nr:helix-turn-helix transcriptional regulator [Paracoccus yeei]